MGPEALELIWPTLETTDQTYRWGLEHQNSTDLTGEASGSNWLDLQMGPMASEFHWLDWRGRWKRLTKLTDGAQSIRIPLTWLERPVETTGRTYRWGREHQNWSDRHCRDWWKRLAGLTDGARCIRIQLTQAGVAEAILHAQVGCEWRKNAGRYSCVA